MIEKFTVSRDDNIYEAWPDVTLTPSGKLICIFSECTHHGDRSYTRIMLTDSIDRGRTWSKKRPLTEGTKGLPYWNSARIMMLKDGRLAAIADRIFGKGERGGRNYLFFSEDEGMTWGRPVETPAQGIVPDKLLELDNDRWIVSCHEKGEGFGYLVQRLWYSDDQGATWSDPVIVGKKEGLNLCEVSILPVEAKLVAFFRENSGMGWPCYKAISSDCGESWGDLIPFPLPGCHRPVSGFLQDGHILITYRFIQGGKGGWGTRTQNFFAALTDRDSTLAGSYQDAQTRILPIDFDRSPVSDLGYSGWVQFEDGEIYIVNYIVDDAPNGQIRGYSLRMEDFILK
ncbi:MAG: sialidase family protein [Candidatus Poribacteria bacterium]|nr:sialidase family protein [Candidatus Poribacteria bacterium]